MPKEIEEMERLYVTFYRDLHLKAHSESIYNRILWDSQFNAAEFVMGYLDRFVGLYALRDGSDQ